MKKQWIVFALVALFTTLLLSNVTSSYDNVVVKAHSLRLPQLLTRQEDCLAYDRPVEPSSNKRTVTFKQFGIKVQIPDNYRTLLRNDGEVWILNSTDYDLIACSARGGTGGRGLYYDFIKSIPNPKNLSLRTLIINNYGPEASFQPYQISGLNGLLTKIPGKAFNSASFFVEIPGIKNIIEISAGCDCDVTAKEIISFLETVSLL